ncbi:MAG: hypothetical protein AAGG11_15160 [Pseudomonadota bacterium]
MYQEAIYFGLIYSVWLSALILMSYRHEPRIWLHDFPQEMQALVPLKTSAEQRLSRLWAVPITGSMILVPLVAALWRHRVFAFSYLDAFLYAGIMMLVFCIVDLIILDGLITVWWRPAWMQLRGAEPAAHHDNFRFHLRRSIAGLAFPLIGAGLVAVPFLWL